MGTTTIDIVIKLLKIWGIFEIHTILFSLLLCFSSYKIFIKAGKKKWQSFIPLYNVFILLDIVKLNKLYMILLLIPMTNILIIFIIMYRLSIVFVTEKNFALGLIVLPAVFLPILNYSNELKLTIEEEKKQDDVSDNMISLLTNNQYNELNKNTEEEVVVDNIFKSETKPFDPVEPFKANKLKYDQIVKEEPKEIKVEKVEPIIVQELNKNKYIILPDDENEIIEIVEL